MIKLSQPDYEVHLEPAMNQESHPEHPRQKTIRRQCKSGSVPSQAYFDLLDEERPVLLVIGDGLIPNNPFCSLRLWINRPLLAFLSERPGDKFIWSPIWWKDDAEPYGKIMLWRDRPSGCHRRHLINTRMGCETVDLGFVSHRKGRLWFPVESINHYAITQFVTHPHGLVFDPLDGFQRHKAIRSRQVNSMKGTETPAASWTRDGLGSAPFDPSAGQIQAVDLSGEDHEID